MKKLYFLCCCCFIQNTTANTIDDNKTLTLTPLSGPEEITIDGMLTETIWSETPTMDDFHQVKPIEFAAPSEHTVIQVTYDSDYLYIAAQLYESDPQAINASQLIQGKSYDFDDRFYVILDTFNQQRSGYFFQLNPNGIRSEALLDEQNKYDNWSTIWQGQSRITEHGWVVEMAIPFKSLNFNTGQDSWGINFGRVIARTEEVIAWSSQGADNWELSPAVAGQATNIHDIKQGLGLDIKVSATATRSTTQSTSAEPALDIFYKPNPNLNIAATINTDFSATEVDDRVINSSRFSIFLPEKRDFFLQDVGIFEFANVRQNGRPFFSRRIGLADDGQAIDLNFGTKLTGRSDRFNYGVLAVEQENQFADKQRLLVARATANVLSESTLGLIATHGNPITGASDHLIGADFNYLNSQAFDNKLVTGGLWIQQAGDQQDNQAYGLSLNYPNDDINLNFSSSTIEANFDPALGFVNRRGIKEHILEGGFQRRFDHPWVRSYYPWMYNNYTTDLSNQKLSQETIIYPATLISPQGDYFELGHQRRSEVIAEPFQLFSRLDIPAGDYQFNANHIRFISAETRKISVSMFYRSGDFFHGKQINQRHALNWRPNNRLYFSWAYNTHDVRLPDEAFKTKLYTFKNEIAFNAAWSLATIIQYDNLSDSIGTSGRLQWQADAFSSLIIAYDSTHFEDTDEILSGRQLSDKNTLTAKYTYTFRY